jgi:hypothetical protein
MLLNLVKRWIYSPLEVVPSPIVEAARARAESLNASSADIADAEAIAHELFPAYELPVCRQYCSNWEAPFHGAGFALVYCEMDITHLAAAKKDPRLIIFNSLEDPLEQSILDSHLHLVDPVNQQALAASRETNARPTILRELLSALSERHLNFSSIE